MLKIITSKDPRIPNRAQLLSINNQPVEDFLEFNFYDDVAKTRKISVESNGIRKEIIFKPDKKILIEFEAPKYRQCENNCDFCFVNGLPKGLRRELYFRDDDYRLSFLFGNFLSLTNINKKDISRIGRLRLSPLYISVHTTDPVLRKKVFKNEKAALIMKQLQALIDQNVNLHCQVVVMPHITDGKNLIRTIRDLSNLYPGVSSIGIVPVGRTRYLKDIALVPKIMAEEIILIVENLHKDFRKKYKRGMVYLADEFFIKTGYAIPETSYYDDFPQYENGVGMARVFIDEVRSLSRIRKVKGKNVILTGKLALPFLNMLKTKLNIDIVAVDNYFFGNSVTVSGLIGANDIARTIRNLGEKYDHLILPPNCVNDQGKFIDNKIISDRRIIVSPVSIKGLIKCLQQ